MASLQDLCGNNPSATMVLEAEQLPDELILEILSRLPSKSLASCMIQYPSPLCFANHGEVLLKDGKDLLLYDPEKKSAKNIKIHGIMDWSDSYAVVTYVPSLVSLQSGTYMGTGQEVDGEVKQYLRDGVLRLRS